MHNGREQSWNSANSTNVRYHQLLDISTGNVGKSSNRLLTAFRRAGSTMDESRMGLKLGKPQRAAIFVESFYPFVSGVSRRFQELVLRLAKNGHKVLILTGKEETKRWKSDVPEVQTNVEIVILTSRCFAERIKNDLSLIIPNPMEIYDALTRFKPDVIHIAEHTPGACACAVIAKHLLNISVVWTIHSNIDYYIDSALDDCCMPLLKQVSLTGFRWLRCALLRHCADEVMTVSHYYANVIQSCSASWFMPSRIPISVWHTGVDCESFNPGQRSQAMRVKMVGHRPGAENKRLFVTVGRISPEKNLEFIMEVTQRFSDVFLCVVGEGPLRSTMEEIYGGQMIHFMGQLRGAELAKAYASADFFICASQSETFGQVYMEAMASGTPILSAHADQLEEFMTNGVHGWLWEPDNLESAVECVKKAIDRKSYSIEARKEALKHSWDRAAVDMAQTYSKVAIRSCENADSGYDCDCFASKKMIRFIAKSKQWIRALIWCTVLVAALCFALPISFCFAYMPGVQPAKFPPPALGPAR